MCIWCFSFTFTSFKFLVRKKKYIRDKNQFDINLKSLAFNLTVKNAIVRRCDQIFKFGKRRALDLIQFLRSIGADNYWFKIAFITGNSSLEPLLEGPFAQIHVNLSSHIFGRNQTGDLRVPRFLMCRALHHWAKVTDESPKIPQDTLFWHLHTYTHSFTHTHTHTHTHETCRRSRQYCWQYPPLSNKHTYTHAHTRTPHVHDSFCCQTCFFRQILRPNVVFDRNSPPCSHIVKTPPIECLCGFHWESVFVRKIPIYVFR